MNEDILKSVKTVLKLKELEVMMVSILPDRPNIFLDVVQRVTHDFEHDLVWLVDGLRNHKQKYPKSIIFANSIRCVGEIFEFFRSSLGRDGFVSGVRTYSMYHGQIGKELQEFTLHNFKQGDTKLRVIISTIAFGMGVEVPDIRQVVHWGRSKSILTHWQEVGRGGRDGQPCTAIWYPQSCAGNDRQIFDAMKSNTDKCIRRIILSSLVLPGMDTSYLTKMDARISCSKNCDNCSCALCMCCSHCKTKCVCSQ